MKNQHSTFALIIGLTTACIAPSTFAQGPQEGMGPGMGMGPGSGRGMGPGYGRGMGRMMPTFGDFDLNGDGQLTEQEFAQARAQRIAERSQQGYMMRGLSNAPTFAAIDLNGDGHVDPQEFAAAQAQHHQGMMRGPMTPPPPAR